MTAGTDAGCWVVTRPGNYGDPEFVSVHDNELDALRVVARNLDWRMTATFATFNEVPNDYS